MHNKSVYTFACNLWGDAQTDLKKIIPIEEVLSKIWGMLLNFDVLAMQINNIRPNMQGLARDFLVTPHNVDG